MSDTTTMGTVAKGVTDLARDAAYVAVGLGVLGYQRAQVQRVELQNRLSKDLSLDQRIGDPLGLAGVGPCVADEDVGHAGAIRPLRSLPNRS